MQFPEDQRLLYSLLIESNLSEAARKVIEMQPGLEKFFNEAQRRNYERGRAEGKAEGKSEGKSGASEGKAEALLEILTRRGLTLTRSSESHRRMHGSRDARALAGSIAHGQFGRRAACVAFDGRAPGPPAWPARTSEWSAQVTLSSRGSGSN